MAGGQEPIVRPELLQLLVCPVDHGILATDSAGLRCTICGRFYPVIGSIPNLVVEDTG